MFVAAELKGLEKSRYLQITSELYATWQSREFMDSQLWLMHRLEETTWEAFITAHRADFGEQAFHRVGSFYDRVGTLVRNRLVDEREILSTIGAYAIAVWHKIEPLVREARQYSFDFLEWKKQFVLKKHWLAHTKSICPRCNIPFHKGHLGRTQRRSFWCENCQVLYE